MSRFINQTFIALMLILLCLGRSFSKTCVSMNNQLCMVRQKLIDLNRDEPYYYPFIISMIRWNGSFNTVQEDVNFKVFNLT